MIGPWIQRAVSAANIREAIELCLETKDQEGWELPPNRAGTYATYML